MRCVAFCCCNILLFYTCCCCWYFLCSIWKVAYNFGLKNDRQENRNIILFAEDAWRLDHSTLLLLLFSNEEKYQFVSVEENFLAFQSIYISFEFVWCFFLPLNLKRNVFLFFGWCSWCIRFGKSNVKPIKIQLCMIFVLCYSIWNQQTRLAIMLVNFIVSFF